MERYIIDKLSKNKENKVKEFIRFLKDEGVYFTFFRILRKNPPGEFQRYLGISDFLEKCPTECWTTSCFCWCDYGRINKCNIPWDMIHEKWNRYARGY